MSGLWRLTHPIELRRFDDSVAVYVCNGGDTAGVNPEAGEVLALLDREGGLELEAIEKKLPGVSEAGGILRVLEESGLVEKIPVASR